MWQELVAVATREANGNHQEVVREQHEGELLELSKITENNGKPVKNLCSGAIHISTVPVPGAEDHGLQLSLP